MKRIEANVERALCHNASSLRRLLVMDRRRPAGVPEPRAPKEVIQTLMIQTDRAGPSAAACSEIAKAVAISGGVNAAYHRPRYAHRAWVAVEGA